MSDRGERFCALCLAPVAAARRDDRSDDRAPRPVPGGDQGLLDERQDARRRGRSDAIAPAPLAEPGRPRSPSRAQRQATRPPPAGQQDEQLSEPNRGQGLLHAAGGPPDAGDYACSGTAVRSPSRSLVWTAGHCVFDPGVLGAGYATNWEFVPGYNGRDESPSASGRRRAWPRPGNGRAPTSSTAGTRPSTSAPPRSLPTSGQAAPGAGSARGGSPSTSPATRCTAAFGYPAEQAAARVRRPAPVPVPVPVSRRRRAASARPRRSGSPAT